MRYNYKFRYHNPSKPARVEWSTEGEIEGTDPRSTVIAVANANTHVLDECQGALSPVITLSRTGDNMFEASVETHGLGDLTVELDPADYFVEV